MKFHLFFAMISSLFFTHYLCFADPEKEIFQRDHTPNVHSIRDAHADLCGYVLSDGTKLLDMGTSRAQGRAALIQSYNNARELPFLAEDVTSLETIFVSARHAFPTATAVAVLVVFPGMGWNTSDHRLIREVVNVTGSRSPVDESAQTVRTALEEAGLQMPLISLVVDPPGHGVGGPAFNYLSGDAMLTWYENVLKEVKRRYPNKPIFALGWSASQPFLQTLVNRNPQLVAGFIGESPCAYGRPGVAETHLLEMAAEINNLAGVGSNLAPFPIVPSTTPSPESWTSFPFLLEQLPPADPQNLSQVPTLYIFSNRDSGVDSRTRQNIADYAKAAASRPDAPLFRVAQYDTFSHEPFFNFGMPNMGQVSGKAYRDLYQFIRDVLWPQPL